MAKKITSVLGIDIGSHRIKICEVKAQGREPVVTALGVVETPEGAVDHTGIYNPEAVAASLKQVYAEAGSSVTNVIASIAGQASVLVRTLEVPKMNATELKEHMQWEISRNIPFAESTVVSDYKPLGDDDPNSTNMDVVMAIAPQSAIDTLIACVKKSGKTPAAFDVEPLSLARSIQQSYDDLLSSKTVCMVEVGAKTTSINIFKGSKLLMPRQVPVGGELFTKQIADTLGVDLAVAEAQKREKLEIPEAASSAPNLGFGASTTQEVQPYNPFSDDPYPAYSAPASPFGETTDFTAPAEAPLADVPPPVDQTPVVADDPEAVRLFNAIAPVLDEFVAEIRRSVDYFRSRGGDVDLILLAGGGSKIKGLATFLTKTLGVECDVYDPLRRLNLNARKATPEFIDEYRSEFAVAIGNALHIFFD